MTTPTSEITKARIVMADDDADNARSVEEALKSLGHMVRCVNEGEAALHLVRTWQPHVVLLDINMPKLTGMEVLRRIRAMSEGEYTGVVLLTANSGLEEIVAGLDAGADDYIVKPYRLPELQARVRACLRAKNLHDTLRRANKRLEEMSHKDDLTGLFNMRFTGRRLAEELETARRKHAPISCVMFDMDNFKSVNDNHGHLFGSEVLCEVAKVIAPCLHSAAIAARYGGDEFLIVLPETRMKDAHDIAERMRKRIEMHVFQHEGATARMTASFGVAGCDAPERHSSLDARELVRLTDSSLYRAKNKCRNSTECFEIG